jgi:hypothetical protein
MPFGNPTGFFPLIQGQETGFPSPYVYMGQATVDGTGYVSDYATELLGLGAKYVQVLCKYTVTQSYYREIRIGGGWDDGVESLYWSITLDNYGDQPVAPTYIHFVASGIVPLEADGSIKYYRAFAASLRPYILVTAFSRSTAINIPF